MKRELGKLQIGLRFGKCPLYIGGGFHPYITFWLLKLKLFPNEGEQIQKKHYKGIFINKVWSPIILLRQRTFNIFGKHFRIVYPLI